MKNLKHTAFRAVTHTVASCSVEDTVVVAGSPRSGTTWLAEIIRELPGYKMLNEPMNLDQHPELQEKGADWRTYIPPDGTCTGIYQHLRSAFQGKEPRVWKWRFKRQSPPGMFWEHVSRRKMIVKLIRAARMLQWVAFQFALKDILFVVRHPCAVVNSMLTYGNWHDHQTSIDRSHVPGGAIPDDLYNEHKSVLESVSSQAGALAVLYCLDLHIAFHTHADAGWPWILVPYERMLKEGKRELRRIVALLGYENVPSPAQERLTVASRSSSGTLTPRDTERQLTKWKRELSKYQIDSILKIIDAFGLDFYSRNAEPDYDRLLRYQRDDAGKPDLLSVS